MRGFLGQAGLCEPAAPELRTTKRRHRLAGQHVQTAKGRCADGGRVHGQLRTVVVHGVTQKVGTATQVW